MGLVLIVGLILGYTLGLFLEREKAFNQGLEQGRKEVEEKYQAKIKEIFPPPLEPKEVFSFLGEIKEIKDKTLTLGVTVHAPNPFQEPKIEKKTVRTNETTKVVKGVAKSQEELAKENSQAEIFPPRPFKKGESILFSDLKVGDIIEVEAEENIKDKTEFTAKTIMLVSPI